jgi:membrane-associated phospholipid phosphatase
LTTDEASAAPGRFTTDRARLWLAVIAVFLVATVAVMAVVLLEPFRMTLVASTGLRPSQSEFGLDELFFGGMTSIGAGRGLVSVVGLVAIALLVRRRWGDAIFAIVAVLGGTFVSRLAKDIYHDPRPPTVHQAPYVPIVLPTWLVVGLVVLAVAFGLIRGWGPRAIAFGAIVPIVLLLQRVIDRLVVPITHGFDAFPSGHALSSATLATAVILIFWHDPRWRWPVAVAAVAYAFLVGMSRLYLGVHYPVDVIAGWCLGAAWALMLWLAWQIAREVRSSQRSGHTAYPLP